MRYILVSLLLLSALWAKPTYTISIVSDGDTEYSQQLQTALKNEITQLLARDFNVKFPKKLNKNGKWDYGTIAAHVNSALKDRRSSLVIALGTLSSHYAARKRSYKKPLIATAIIDPKMQRVPYKNGTSGKWNLTYVSGHQTLDEDIKTIKEIMSVKKVAVLIDATMFKNTPEVGRYIGKKFTHNKIKVELIPIGKNVESDLEKISEDVDFVYVTPLFQQTKAERAEIYETLSLKELPTFAGIGQDDVELGALFANAPATDNKRFIRQIALDVQQIALGSNASNQLVNFTPHPALSLNMQTANDIGFTPSWELLSKATLIQSEQSDSHFFTIEEIMDRAIQHNLQVISSENQVDISQANVEQADAAFLPQIHFGAEAAKVDEDRAIASFGQINETRIDAYLKASQEIFNQRVTANISVNENFLEAQNKATDFLKLDIGLAASVAYLRILQLRTKLQIEKSNLELSKTNMRAAITKRNIGLGNASDIYRWESQIAGNKKTVLFTHATLQQAKHSLNALLNLPQDLPLNFEPIDMDNPVFMTHHPEMKDYFLEQKKFASFQNYLVENAKRNMPSIQQFDALEKAKQLIMESNDDALYMPTVALEGGIVKHFVDVSNEVRDTSTIPEVQALPYADDTDWEVGIFLRYPLYTGGGMSAELEASKAAYYAAEAQRNDVINNAEKNVRNALYQAKASYLSIKLAEAASISSKKNLELIKGIYIQGGTGIIELLDAQHTALRAALVENNTRYGFMRDLLTLQHNIGQVNFNLDDEDWTLWASALTQATLEDD